MAGRSVKVTQRKSSWLCHNASVRFSFYCLLIWWMQTLSQTYYRLHWSRPSDFMFTLLGYSIGLGILWRFPYLCYRNGGGAFLVPFLLSCIVISIPLYTFEIGLGQFTQRGRLSAWDRIPVMKGMGLASVIVSTWSIIPYMLIMGWCVMFLFNSFTIGNLPWTTCDNIWNTNSCVPMFSGNLTNGNKSFHSVTITSGKLNLTSQPDANHILPQVEFWRHRVLQVSSGFDDAGLGFNSTMLPFLIFAFVSVFMVTIKGVKSSGKVVYLTVTLPYITLFVLLIRGVTLDGAWDGIKMFLYPKMEMLLKPSVWMEGISQAFYVYGLGFPGLTAFGSYNKKRADFFKQSVFIIPCGIVTSIIMGFVTFSILGNLAYTNNVEITSVIKSGPGLVFQVIPSALAQLPIPQLWSALFFLTLYFVAIDSAFGEFEALSTVVIDALPKLGSTYKRRALTNGGIALFLFSMCQIMLTGPGIYWFELMNYYGANGICLIWIVTCESLAVGWLWDARKYRHDVKMMVGRKLPRVFDYCYKFAIPVITVTVLTMYCVEWEPLTIADYVYPMWANVIGWMMSLSSILCIPIVAVVTLYKENGSLLQRWISAKTSKIDFASIHCHDNHDQISISSLSPDDGKLLEA